MHSALISDSTTSSYVVYYDYDYMIGSSYHSTAATTTTPLLLY